MVQGYWLRTDQVYIKLYIGYIVRICYHFKRETRLIYIIYCKNGESATISAEDLVRLWLSAEQNSKRNSTCELIPRQPRFAANGRVVFVFISRWDRSFYYSKNCVIWATRPPSTIKIYFSSQEPVTEFGDFNCKQEIILLLIESTLLTRSFITFTLNCLIVPSRAAALPEK